MKIKTRCILNGEGKMQTYCNKYIMSGYIFLNIKHAENAIKNKEIMQPCVDCLVIAKSEKKK